MWEHQIAAAALHVERHPQVLKRDRRALDVPAGTTCAEAAVPGGFSRLGCLPQQAVEWVLLADSIGVAAALAKERQHLLAWQVSHRAKAWTRTHREVRVSVDFVRGAEVFQAFDESDYRADCLDGTYVVGRWKHAERRH